VLGFTALVLVRGTLIQSATFPDWKTQPAPPPQPSMPDPLTAPVRPALHVFDSLHFDVHDARLPAEAKSVLTAAGSAQPGLHMWLMNNTTFLLLPLLLVWWLWLLVRRRPEGAPSRWRRLALSMLGGIVVYVVLLGAIAYHFGREF